MLDLIDALRGLLGTEDVELDDTGAEPFVWRPGTLYVYPSAGRLAERPFETGPTRRQDFTLSVVYVADAEGEEPDQQRSRAVSEALDAKRTAYLDLVRRNAVSTSWHHVEAAERPAPATLQTRAVALDVTGYRFIGG